MLRIIDCFDRWSESYSTHLEILLTLTGFTTIFLFASYFINNWDNSFGAANWLKIFLASFIPFALSLKAIVLAIRAWPKKNSCTDIDDPIINTLFAIGFFALWALLFFNSLPRFFKSVFY